MTLANLTPANYARAAVEGLLCLMGAALDAVRAQGVDITEVTLTGGGAKSACAKALAPAILGLPVNAPAPDEYVVNGAARQAAWTLAGTDEPPAWAPTTKRLTATLQPHIRAAYNNTAQLLERG